MRYNHRQEHNITWTASTLTRSVNFPHSIQSVCTVYMQSVVRGNCKIGTLIISVGVISSNSGKVLTYRAITHWIHGSNCIVTQTRTFMYNVFIWRDFWLNNLLICCKLQYSLFMYRLETYNLIIKPTRVLLINFIECKKKLLWVLTLLLLNIIK